MRFSASVTDLTDAFSHTLHFFNIQLFIRFPHSAAFLRFPSILPSYSLDSISYFHLHHKRMAFQQYRCCFSCFVLPYRTSIFKAADLFQLISKTCQKNKTKNRNQLSLETILHILIPHSTPKTKKTDFKHTL